MLRFVSKGFEVAGYVIQYACITHCVFEYIGDFVVCNGSSMEPTLYTNNVLVSERISTRLHKVHRGDIVIAKSPSNPSQNICKRIVGLPGDRIVLSHPFNYNPFRNISAVKSYVTKSNMEEEVDTILDEENKKQVKKKISTREIIVPRGHVWIEGDNSGNSSDSRSYGPIPQGLIQSRAVCRLWPLSDIKLLV